MTGALFFLIFHSWKNRMLMRIRRLRRPKYFLGLLVGVAWIYFYFVRLVFNPRTFGGSGPLTADPSTRHFFELAGAMVLFTLMALAWTVPGDRAALAFSEAEVNFLFPAPVSRRLLVHYKLLKSQIAILFAIGFFQILGLLAGRTRTAELVLIHATGWWLILSTLSLHRLASSFALTFLFDRGLSNRARRAIAFAALAAFVGVTAVWAWRTLPPPPPPSSDEINRVADFKYYLQKVFESGPLVYLLVPFRLLLGPYFAQNLPDFLRAIGPALLFPGVLYVLVVRSNVAFEEASVEASRKLAERIAAIRSGRRHPLSGARKRKRAPFTLRPSGPPVVAFLWKNLIGAGQGFSLRMWLILVWVAIVVGFMSANNPKGTSFVLMLGPVVVMLFAMSFLMGPQLVRQDFRQDLPMADQLKSYPLPAWQVALGEMLAPVAILTALQWCLVALAVAMLPNIDGQIIPVGPRLAVAAAAAVLSPGLNLITLLIPNAAVLLFPGWFQTGRDGPQGIEATGQRLLFAIGQLLVLVVALVPATIMFALVWFGSRMLVGPVGAIPSAAVATAAVMLVEAGFGVMLLGKLFERLDVSSESTPG